jgi:hypothetical protein
MPNKNHHKGWPSKGAATGPKPGPHGKVNEKSPNWAGIPGKTQPRSRDKGGDPKVRQAVKSEGI